MHVYLHGLSADVEPFQGRGLRTLLALSKQVCKDLGTKCYVKNHGGSTREMVVAG